MVCMWTVISSYVVKNKKATQKKPPKKPQNKLMYKIIRFEFNREKLTILLITSVIKYQKITC